MVYKRQKTKKQMQIKNFLDTIFVLTLVLFCFFGMEID